MAVCPQGEFGHLVLLAIFDCVDDTKLVKQAVLSVSLMRKYFKEAVFRCVKGLKR